MNHSNSIEGYCQTPMSQQQINDMQGVMTKAKERQSVFYRVYLAVLAALGVGLVVALACQGLGFGIVISFFMAISLGLLVGAFISEEMAPDKKIHICIHGVDMAVGLDCLDAVEAPQPDQVGSSLAKNLIKSINTQDRKMVVFEKALINRLSQV